jgi:hypothetical protein
MIRLRIERLDLDAPLTGIVYHEHGFPVGRVIIEQQVATFDPAVPKGMDCYPEKWVPVEVIDD